ncbi:MAG: hypothetical protein Ct9H300mP27_06190 [Chloroflexota bacterium]|nr:MAG: hypothetical protein Ct9H300mP27_06190 [Chloroflexota bacterium]
MGWSNTCSRFGGLLLVPAIAWAINPDKEDWAGILLPLYWGYSLLWFRASL